MHDAVHELFATAVGDRSLPAAVTRDGQDSGTVRIIADGCAHCPEDMPSPER